MPGCWAIYGEVLAREFGDYRYARLHQLTADAYAAQHPGTPSRQSIQSVGLHLIGLLLVLEEGYRPEQTAREIQRAASRKADFTWLPPPPLLGETTVVDVLAAKNPEEHLERVRQWAQDVWRAWSPHHESIRRWAHMRRSGRQV